MHSFGSFEFVALEKKLKDYEFYPENRFSHRFRYSIIRDQDLTLIFGAKIPIIVPILNDPPIELVNFYISLAVRPRWSDENITSLSLLLATTLKELVDTLPPYTYDFNLSRYKEKIKDLVKTYYPQVGAFPEEHMAIEHKVYAEIRDHFLIEETNSQENIAILSQDILDIYREFHLQPSKKLPIELKQGLPRTRKDWVVFFKRDDTSEYLIEEPGSISYWRDYSFNNVWIRTALDSHNFNLWYKAFRDQNFKMNYLFYDWIVYCRGLIKPILKALDIPQLKHQNLVDLNEVSFIEKNVSRGVIPGLFLPMLVYEVYLEKNAYQKDTSLFTSAPSSLEEMSAISDYNSALSFLNKGDLNSAQEYLINAERKLRKFHHVKGQVKVLFSLYDIAIKRKDYSKAIADMQRALDLAKGGKVSLQQIITIHLNLIRAYSYLKKKEDAEKHLKIALSFLKSLSLSDPTIYDLYFKVNLEMARLHTELHEFQEASKFFKEVNKLMRKKPLYEFLYYYERSIFYGLLGKENKRFLALEKAISIQDAPRLLYTRAHVELAKIYLYNKNEPKKAIELLLSSLRNLTLVSLEIFKMKVDIYEMLADAYKAIQDEEKASQALQEAESIKEQMDRLS